MAARRLPWIKFWPESVDHEKLSMLSDGAFRTWVHALAKASQQATRWRFASVQHAANVTGRPVKHIQELIKGRLLELRDGEVWIHDYRDWQEVYESDMPLKGSGQDSVNTPSRLPESSPEDSANSPARPRAPASDGRREMRDVRPETGDGRPEGPGGAGGEPSMHLSPSAPPPNPALPGQVTLAPKPTPRRDRFAETLDAIKELDPDLVIGGDRSRNAKAVNESMAEPALLASAYVALMRGEWQDNYVAKQGSLHVVVDNIGGYVNAKRGLASPPPNGTGPKSRGSSQAKHH
jgi:hypothetical protein